MLVFFPSCHNLLQAAAPQPQADIRRFPIKLPGAIPSPASSSLTASLWKWNGRLFSSSITSNFNHYLTGQSKPLFRASSKSFF
ncbi:hypothetical protein O181_053489 [Austropuccinia psidii MF-1]|uniref:Uncharacterized protein n=1 Tax=Austropuccinia psidii MF-1 TaxID=1389203 RepID=A0A9Q3HSP9_9BASI|nr:hypothetical protein [Austropuccinia psidii MF-1]